jgi:hypothetical protein
LIFSQKFRRGQMPDSPHFFFGLDFSQKFRVEQMPDFPLCFLFYLDFFTTI